MSVIKSLFVQKHFEKAVASRFSLQNEWGTQVGERQTEGCTVSQEGRILDEPPRHPMDSIYLEKCVFYCIPSGTHYLTCVWVIFLFLVMESGCDLARALFSNGVPDAWIISAWINMKVCMKKRPVCLCKCGDLRS